MSKSNFVSGTAFFFAVKQGQSCPPYRRDEIMRGLIIIILIQAWVQVLWGLKLIPFGGASSRRRIKIHKYEIEHDRKCLLRRKKVTTNDKLLEKPQILQTSQNPGK